MKKINILIVEDDEGIVSNIIIALKRNIPNLQPFVATNKVEALNLLKSEDFGLITLDGQLLDGDHGREVLKEMTDEQVLKTLVYSADLKFLKECEDKGIKTLGKGDRFIGYVVFLSNNGESIEIKA